MKYVTRWGALLLALVVALPIPVVAQETDPVMVAQSLINHCVAGEFEAAAASFTPEMQELLPAAKLQQTWESIVAQVGTFDTQLDMTTQQVEGNTVVVFVLQFEKAVLDAQVSVTADGEIGGFYISPHQGPPPPAYEPPAYADQAQFTEREIMLNTGTQWELSGTLTLPVGDGPFPAVVLVQGSGAHDRDESYGPNKPFKDLAWGLASQGIAVLRYDKRTLVHGSEMIEAGAQTVQEETIDDALAAVDFLQTVDAVDPARVFVLGHSLGGYLAPRIASQSDAIAGLVVMAGNARPLEDLMFEQVNYLAGLAGELTPEQAAQLDALRAEVEAIKALESLDNAPDQLLGIPAAYWFDLRTYDPVATAQELALPMLFLQGERDYQVTMDDFQAWQAGLADHDNVTFETFPALNHLFMAGEGQPTPEEYAQPGHVDEPVINTIAQWILTF